jgi:hypothetical protein
MGGNSGFCPGGYIIFIIVLSLGYNIGFQCRQNNKNYFFSLVLSAYVTDEVGVVSNTNKNPQGFKILWVGK